MSSVLKQSKYIRKEHEYILVYAKNKLNLVFNRLKNTMIFENLDNDPKGAWFSSNAASPNQNSDKNKFAIKLPKDDNMPRLKIYQSDYDANTAIMSSIFTELGSITSAKDEVRKVLGLSASPFDTPKPEALLKRIIEISTQENDLVLDFFAGSGTTCAVAHKLKRKYIGIEMGEHFESVILPRLKKVIGGFKSGVAKGFNGGGVVKVYALESYEEILRKIKYEDNDKPLAYDEQYSDLVECKNESYTLNLNALEKMGVDIKETLENLWGLKVEFFNERVVKFKGNDKEVEILKALKEALIW
ncbi:site-specific DNA-methyltransferase [Helicobacter pylori]|nr:site-specific DNA-methyltransferase [Helicobacter pylori]